MFLDPFLPVVAKKMVLRGICLLWLLDKSQLKKWRVKMGAISDLGFKVMGCMNIK